MSSDSIVIAASAGFCVSRNIQAHAAATESRYLQRCGVHQRKNFIRQTISRQAKTQSLTFIDRIAEYGIPIDVLQNTIHNDMEENVSLQQMYRNSTLCSVNHCGERFIVHGSGSHLDEMTIRSSEFSVSPQIGCEFIPGYTVNIGQGSTLRQVLCAGTSHGGSSSNILAATVGEIFHLQTVSGPDFSMESVNVEMNTNDYYDNRRRREHVPLNLHGMSKLSAAEAIQANREVQYSACPMLDPKGKWQLPNEIWQITSLSSNQSYINHALVLTKRGSIFSWTPGYGIRLEIDSIEDFSPFHQLDVPLSREFTSIAGSKHPKLAHFAHNKTIATIDLRCKQLSFRRSFADENDYLNAKICSVQHHGRNVHEYMLSTDRAMLLMDMRYEKSPLRHQSSTYGHATLQYHHVEDHRSRASIDFFLGRSSWQEDKCSNQMFAPDVELHSLQKVGQMSTAAVPTFALLDSATPRCPARWQVDRFATVDRDIACVGAWLHTKPALPRISKSDASYLLELQMQHHYQVSGGLTQQAMDDWLAARYNAVLLKQNALGDIYAQQLWWDADAGHSATQETTSKERLMPTNESDDNSRASSSASTSSSYSSTSKEPVTKRVKKTVTLSEPSRDPEQSEDIADALVRFDRQSIFQWNGRIGDRGRSPRAIQQLYRRFLQLFKQQSEQQFALYAALNPQLTQQLAALHRFLQPSRSQLGRTAMHVKLHEGLRLPLTLPAPRDASAHRMVAPVHFYRTSLPEDALQSQDVFLVDLRALHLHKYPPKPKCKTKLNASTKAKERRHESVKSAQAQDEIVENLIRLQEYLADHNSSALEEKLVLSLYEIWNHLHYNPQCCSNDATPREGQQPPQPQQQPSIPVHELYQALTSPSLESRWSLRSRLSLRFEHSVRDHFSRFSDGLYVTGTRVSRIDRVAHQHAFLRRRLATKPMTTRKRALGIADDRVDDLDGDEVDSAVDDEEKYASDDDPNEDVDEGRSTNTGAASFKQRRRRRMCECYWRLVTSPSGVDFDDINSSIESKNILCGRRSCVAPHLLLFTCSQKKFTASPISDDNTAGDNSALDSSSNALFVSQPASQTFDLRSLIQGSGATVPADNSGAVPTASSLPTATPAASLLSQLIFQPPATAPTTASLPVLAAKTPAAALVTAHPTTTTTAPQTVPPPPMLSATWQQSDVTPNVLQQLADRWNTHTSSATNFLRDRLMPHLANNPFLAMDSSRSLKTPLRTARKGNRSEVGMEEDDQSQSFVGFTLTGSRHGRKSNAPRSSGLLLPHFWELGDDEE